MRLTFLLLLISSCAIGQDIERLKFIENKGQWNSDIDFEAQVPGGRVGVSAKGFSILLLDRQELEDRHMAGHRSINESDGLPSNEPINGHYFQINLIGSNLNAKLVLEQPLEGYSNYFLGSDSCRWATNALGYASIQYKNVYDGIDFRVSSEVNNLKYDFIVKPEADPSQIRIEYCGVDNIEQTNNALRIETTVGPLTEVIPLSYQHDDNNTRQLVASEYNLQDKVISFSFSGDYDECRTLVIDPLLIFSTYSGSTADNWGSTATPGEHGTLYSAGVTQQSSGGFFPATTGAFQTSNRGSFDIAIIKYDSVGMRFLYATHLGGSGNDSPESLVVDKTTGDLVVLGISGSSDYPTSTNSFDKTFNLGTKVFNRVLFSEDQWDIVVTRLSPQGDRLIGSTFLGGSGNDGLNLPKQSGGLLVANYGDEMRGDVITDELGNVYISSVTGSVDFPIVNGFDNSFNGDTTDGIVVKLTSDLSSILWSSFLGGSGFDAAYSIKFDADKNIVLAGGTTSTNFPTTPGAYQTIFNGTVDGWIARVAADGSAILNATLTGTALFDQVYFIDLNSSGNVFCYGQTTGQMPVTPGVYRNPNSGQFLQKFSPDLSTLQFSTIFGSGSGSGLIVPNISPTAFLVNDCNNIYMAGWGGVVNSDIGFWPSTTFGMPVTSDAFQKTTTGSDFYFIVLNGDATQLVYSTYLGGGSSKTHVDGGTSRFDKFGIVYHAVCSGCQFGNTTGGPTSDFPTTPNAKSRLNGSSNCNNAAFKFDLSSLRAVLNTNNLALTQPGFNNVCYPDSIVFQNLSTGGRIFAWDLGDGTIVNQDVDDPRFIIHQYKQPGQYKVKLKITDLSTCSQTDSTFKVINYFRNTINVEDDVEICEGTTHQLMAPGGTVYSWVTADKSFNSTSSSPVVQPKVRTQYFVTVTDVNGCVKKDTVQVSVVSKVDLEWQYNINANCVDRPSIVVKNITPPANGVTFRFDFGDGTISTDTEVEHFYQNDNFYSVKLIAQKKFCLFEENVQLPFYKLFVPNVFTPDASLGFNDTFVIGFGPNAIDPTTVGLTLQLSVVDRWGNNVFKSSNYKNDWNANNIEGGIYYFQLKVGDFASCRDWVHIIK